MVRNSRQATLRHVVIRGIIGVILVGGLAWPRTGVAFDHTWLIVSSSAPSVECDLWDDAPGAGANNESGFFWVQTDTSGNESCTALATISGKTSTSSTLSTRVAVNDYSRFKIELRSGSEFCAGGHVVGTLMVSGAEANSAFVTKTITLPAGEDLSEVCVTVDDNPNSVASQRASALIDYIQVASGNCLFRPTDVVASQFTGRYLASPSGFSLFTPSYTVGGICWRETFSARY